MDPSIFLKIAAGIQAAEAAETPLFPVFFHSQDGQRIAGIVMVSEELLSVALPILASAFVKPGPAPIPAPAPIATAPTGIAIGSSALLAGTPTAGN
jgi:hypothetical protein